LEQGLQDKNQPLLENLLTDKSTQKILADGLSKLWTIQPQDVADSGKVEELYSRLDRQLKSLTQTLEQNGQTQSQTFRAASNMTQNLDFLQQINQAYTYVQLPLRLQQGDAHGDLYVYTNKRSLAAKDGQISALLHLDMEHLGPVDVYVAMQGEHVNTRFYVQDDEMLDFLEEHMDILTERLQKRGYDCNFAMQVRQENAEPESGLKGLLAEEPALPIAQYSFDVRA
jgi:flagellar hook-length control protein FliK